MRYYAYLPDWYTLPHSIINCGILTGKSVINNVVVSNMYCIFHRKNLTNKNEFFE